MEFILQLATEPSAARKSRLGAVMLAVAGMYLLFLLLFISLPQLGYATLMVTTSRMAGVSGAAFYTIAAILLLVPFVLLVQPANRKPYRRVVISEAGVRSENGQLQMGWSTISNLRLRHDVLSIVCTDEDDLQLSVRPPQFDVKELETFAFACIALAAKHRQ